MKHKSKGICLSLAFLCALLPTVFAIRSLSAQLSNNDLLVTQSYVDKEIQNAKTEIRDEAYEAVRVAVGEAIDDEYAADIRETVRDMVENDAQLRAQLVASIGDFHVSYSAVLIKAGQTLSGECEFIPRSGTAVAVCPGVNGINDITSGTDLANGAKMPLNHACCIPRDDGRGVYVSTDAYFLIRGNYHIGN